LGSSAAPLIAAAITAVGSSALGLALSGVEGRASTLGPRLAVLDVSRFCLGGVDGLALSGIDRLGLGGSIVLLPRRL